MTAPAIVYWLLLVNQSTVASPDLSNVSWSTELNLPALGAIDTALNEPFSDGPQEVTLKNKSTRQLKSCRDFLAAASSIYDAPTENDWNILQETGTRCFALKVLASAKPASRSFLTWFHCSPSAVAKLPPLLDMLSSSESEVDATKADKACRPWGKYDRSLKVKTKTAEEADLWTSGWNGRLVVYARGDFNGDGSEDLLLRRDAYAEGGTAASSMVFVISQTSAKGCSHVTNTFRLPSGGNERR